MIIVRGGSLGHETALPPPTPLWRIVVVNAMSRLGLTVTPPTALMRAYHGMGWSAMQHLSESICIGHGDER